MNHLDSQTQSQIATRLRSLFESARRFQQRRSRPTVRAIKPRALPQESQLELGLSLD